MFHLGEVMNKNKATNLSPVVLAFVGDAVYSLFVRERLTFTKDYKTGVLNEMATKYDGKLTVNCGSTIVDARSLLALFALIGRQGIKLVAPDHENPNKFIEIVKKIG
jgi:hypothetical protein